MRTKNELYQQALRTVAMRRQTARALAQDAQAEAEAAIPGLRHAEEEVRVRGIRCAIAGASGKDRTETAAALAAAKQKLTALLAESGRPADALEPKFTCKRCEDTGAVDGRTCDCVRRVMQQLRRKEIEELSSLSISSFDTMQLDYYPNTVDKTLGESVRSYMAGVLATCGITLQTSPLPPAKACCWWATQGWARPMPPLPLPGRCCGRTTT